MKEVELKCWVTPENQEKIENFLASHTVFLGKKEKHDRNFCHAGEKKGEQTMAFRLREEYSENAEGVSEGRKFWVTEKQHHYSANGVEMNDEREFEVSDGSAFEAFVCSQGFEMFYAKEKYVTQYKESSDSLSMLFEYLSVPDLGKFLEVEIICEEGEVNAAEEKIFRFFQEQGIEGDIEKAPYVVLLGKGKVS